MKQKQIVVTFIVTFQVISEFSQVGAKCQLIYKPVINILNVEISILYSRGAIFVYNTV